MIIEKIILYHCKFISESDSKLVIQALKGDTLDEVDQEDFLELLSRVDCHHIPTSDNIRHTPLSMARKELIQQPKYALDAMAETARAGFSLLLPDIDALHTMYASKKPTSRKVIRLLDCTATTKEQTAVYGYLKDFIKGLDEVALRKFVRFVTGAEVICTDEVAFNKLRGLERTSKARTCGPLLEISSSYGSYRELRQEFLPILESNYLNMELV